ncbi:hypothetical protein C8F04DRAFT_1265708 [Mycena alexandri]|uniref:RING-type domain-containing protein n=1 Tax=Mycena alexandri TaxID=1745969 RepID=A0AAD6SN63_9AGAR|nr:hypothetical protein C8F04DRAFT_1265708 [Mycena alexandri]
MASLSKIRPQKNSRNQLSVDVRGYLVETGERRISFGGPLSMIGRPPTPPRVDLRAPPRLDLRALPTHDRDGRCLSTRERVSVGRAATLSHLARESDATHAHGSAAPGSPPRPGSLRAPIEVLSSPGSPNELRGGVKRTVKRSASDTGRHRSASDTGRRIGHLYGVRVPQVPPVAEGNWWLTKDRPPTLVAATGHLHQMCGLCYEVKAHPVSYRCGHSHCYVCIRMWLEKSWACPEPLCGQRMYEEPFRHEAEEQALAAAFPGWCSKTRVSYSWAGLTFPKKPKSIM